MLARRLLNAFGSRWLWAASLVLDRVGVPALRLWPDRRVRPRDLTDQVTAILRGWGMTPEHIPITVEHLLYADLHGIDSHGCGMLRHYQRLVNAGVLSTTAQVEVVRDGASTALVDGGGGLGHFPADLAMKMAIAKCHESGVAVVAVRNSGHFGAAGAYAALAARAGCIGMALTNTAQPAVVPTFGADAQLGTNPIAFAAPACRNRPFLLDMATSTVPVGKLTTAWRAGQSIPAGWAQDPQGNPVTQARGAAQYRRLTPLGSSPAMGSHKGYGLAAMVEILTSVLPGSRVGEDRVGHCFLAIDPRRFREEGDFEAGLDGLLDSLRDCRPIDPSRPVQVAGDPEYAALEDRQRTGVPLSRAVIEDVRAICRDAGVAFTL